MRRRTLSAEEDEIENEGLDAEDAEIECTAAVRSKPRRVDRKRLAWWARWFQVNGEELSV